MINLIRREFCGAILFDYNDVKYYYIDEEATSNLELVIKNKDRENPYFKAFVSNGLIDWECNPIGRIVKSNSDTSDVLIAPLTVFLQITNKCNLCCKHCFTYGENEQPELSTEELYAVIDQLEKIGVCELVIGGGEPLLRKDLLDILKYAQDKGIVPSITTNGHLVTPETAQRLKELHLGYVKVSIDGLVDHHDYIRGNGNYSKALNGLRILLQSGIKNVGVRMVINSINFSDIRGLHDELVKIGCKNLSFSLIRPSGNANLNDELYEGLNQDIFQDIVKVINDLRSIGLMNVNLSEDAPYVEGIERNESIMNILLPGFGCPIKGTVCEIDAFGNMSPCGFLKGVLGDEVIGGNIKVDDILKIWNYSNAFCQFRNMEFPDKCKSCEKVKTCTGGCRVRALHAFGKYDMFDPLCIL